MFGADPKFFPQLDPVAQRSRSASGVTVSNQQVIVLVVSLVLMLLLRLLVQHTRVGKAMRAVSHNHMAASLMGISVDRIITFTFMIGSALAAAAGVLVALQSPKIEPYMGIMPGLKAFVAAVLGGIGNIPGAVVGGLVMGVAEVLVTGLPLADLPRRDRVRAAHRHPARAPGRHLRQGRGGEGLMRAPRRSARSLALVVLRRAQRAGCRAR